MPGALFKAVYVPRSASNWSSSQKSGRQHTDEYVIELPSEQKQQGRLDLSIRKVKLTKYTKPMITLKKVNQADMKPSKSSIPEVKRITQRVIHGGTSQSELNKSNCRMTGGKSGPHTVNQDVFTFSQANEVMPTSQAHQAPQQARARLSVLRTISRMLQENQGIRERLVPITQARY